MNAALEALKRERSAVMARRDQTIRDIEKDTRLLAHHEASKTELETQVDQLDAAIERLAAAPLDGKGKSPQRSNPATK